MTQAFLTLPHKAGRAYRALRAGVDGASNQMLERYGLQSTGTIRAGGKDRGIRTTNLANPGPDHSFLARRIINSFTRDLAEFDAASPATRKRLLASEKKPRLDA